MRERPLWISTSLFVSTSIPRFCTFLYEGAYGNAALSMFGRDLIEQVRADAKGGNRLIPVIVEKCILAVEALGKDNLLSRTLLY